MKIKYIYKFLCVMALVALAINNAGCSNDDEPYTKKINKADLVGAWIRISKEGVDSDGPFKSTYCDDIDNTSDPRRLFVVHYKANGLVNVYCREDGTYWENNHPDEEWDLDEETRLYKGPYEGEVIRLDNQYFVTRDEWNSGECYEIVTLKRIDDSELQKIPILR